MIVVIALGILLGVVYSSYVLPPFYAGATRATFIPLIFEIPVAVVLSGLIGYRISRRKRPVERISAGLVIATVAVCSVLCLALLIVLNVRGT